MINVVPLRMTNLKILFLHPIFKQLHICNYFCSCVIVRDKQFQVSYLSYY